MNLVAQRNKEENWIDLAGLDEQEREKERKKERDITQILTGS